MNAISTEPWVRGAILILLILVVLAPVFGWAAGAVGYAEPLENAAEATGAHDAATQIIPGLLPDYTVPGLSSPVGTFLAGVIGTALTLVVAGGTGRLLEQ
jgi:cobalt/nickel transport protein